MSTVVVAVPAFMPAKTCVAVAAVALIYRNSLSAVAPPDSDAPVRTSSIGLSATPTWPAAASPLSLLACFDLYEGRPTDTLEAIASASGLG